MLRASAEDARDIGTYLGMFVISFAALVGPPISGALLTRYGGFEQVSIFCGVVVLAGGFSVLLVKYMARSVVEVSLKESLKDSTTHGKQ